MQSAQTRAPTVIFGRLEISEQGPLPVGGLGYVPATVHTTLRDRCAYALKLRRRGAYRAFCFALTSKYTAIKTRICWWQEMRSPLHSCPSLAFGLMQGISLDLDSGHRVVTTVRDVYYLTPKRSQGKIVRPSRIIVSSCRCFLL